MIIERKQKREYWVSAVLNGIPDVAIAGVVALIFDEGFLIFVGVVIGLKAVYLAVWLKNSIWLWIRYMVRDRKLIFRRFLDFLIENKFPKPGEIVLDAEDYLEKVVADEQVDIKVRLKAAAEIGALSYLKGTLRIQEGLRIMMPLDDAVEEYNRKISET